MTNSQLQGLIDDALDAGDMDEVKRLASYLKESLRIQLERRLEKINESKYSHINSFASFKKKEVIYFYDTLKIINIRICNFIISIFIHFFFIFQNC